MNPSLEQIEQCAQVCWEAQRALIVSRAPASFDSPASWYDATNEERHAARERVCELWRVISNPPPSLERFDDTLVRTIVARFARSVMGEERL